MKHLLTGASVIALSTLAFGTVAHAQACDPSTPTDGDTVSCAGTGTGVDFSGIDDLDVSVTGTITETTGNAFTAGDGLTLNNSGAMSNTANGTYIIEAGDDAYITNSGTMSSETTTYAKGLSLGDDSTFVQTETGTLSGAGSAIGGLLDMGENATVVNAGAITYSGYTVGISMDSGAVTNTGTITGNGTAIYSWGTLDVTNSGTIHSNSTAMAAVYASGDVTVVNEEGGEISADSGSAILALSGALTLTNYGTISGNSQFTVNGTTADIYNGTTGVISGSGASVIYASSGLSLVNDGLIEGGVQYTIRAGGTGTSIVNNGTISNTSTSSFPMIYLEGTDATVTNTGTIESASTSGAIIFSNGGTLTNTGTITNTGTGAAVLASSDYDMEITNYGTISGYTAYRVYSTGDTTITNYGTIIGTGGTAIEFGDGDDTLVLYSLDIEGDIIFGDGDDTVVVGAGASAGTLTFGSDLENVDLSAAEAAIYSNGTLVVADAGFLGGMDEVQAWGSLLLGRQVTTGFGAGWWGEVGLDTAEGQSQGTLTIGRDFDRFGMFVSATRGLAEGDDGLNEAERDSVLAGLRMGADLGAARLTGAVYAGQGETTFSAVEGGIDYGSTDDTVLGLAAGVETTLANGLGLAARAGVERHDSDAYSLSSLADASFGSRVMTASYLDVEASWGLALPNGLSARPFVGASLVHVGGDKTAMSYGGETIEVDGATGDTQSTLNLGASFGGTGGWSARVETRFDGDGLKAGGISYGVSF